MAIGIVCALVVFAGMVVAAEIVGLNSLAHTPSRKHLKPIPITSAACPYVRVMHVAATKFQSAFPGLTTNISALDPSRWRTTRRELTSTTDVFERAIFV